MAKRTESDILSRAPITVKLGEANFDIRPLAALKAREWRMELVKVFAPLVASFDADANMANVSTMMLQGLIHAPEQIADMVFMYAPNIAEQKQQVLETATEEQLAQAFSAIMGLAYPFLAQVGMIVNALRAQLTVPEKEKQPN
jgi:hypothetical protein